MDESQGRSKSQRISKALPDVPTSHEYPPVIQFKTSSPTSISISLHSPLPPLPKSSMAIPRRPVGVGGSSTHSALDSISSLYSDSPGFPRSSSNSSRRTKDSLSGIDSEAATTPPLPPKDEQRRRSPQTPNHVLAQPAAGFQPSPPRPEIWRRRSLKSDKGILVPGLKLDRSNGSTASPPGQQTIEQSLPAAPTQLPRSITGRKPVPIPARPAPPQPEHMGAKLSKLKSKETTTLRDDSSRDGLPTLPYRLPTPEYESDRPKSSTPQILSPVSPETPPNENPPRVPLKSESRGAPIAAPLANTTNRPNLMPTLSLHSQDLSETLTVASEPPIMRSPQPKKAFAARILTPQPSPPSEASILEPTSLTPVAVPFPRPSKLAPKGTVFAPPTPTMLQYECYQSHRFMRNSRNTLCPVGCMVCQRKDMDKRWRCTWCDLAACGSCMEVLVSIPGRDLALCMERLGVQR